MIKEQKKPELCAQKGKSSRPWFSLCAFLRFLVESEFLDMPSWHWSEGEVSLLLRNTFTVAHKLKSCFTCHTRNEDEMLH